ncbi:MAG TPA: UDP-2,4-diacetamido-2,4,6-trideoxy-beta-L-altropyranose hydrolase [Xanthobacteraceae bacterium]|nr:UDP-2,4-diacetamido-2,4,6-trideoxy-beta-L-altropyranose hydrolase [Xanthobacteraceae bacterium]
MAVIRCDATPTIGAGHAARCQALAEALTESGWHVTFATRELSAAVSPHIMSNFATCKLAGAPSAEPDALKQHLAGGADLLVVDHYARDIAFERRCRGWARQILAIDDRTGRRHDCDLLVDAAASGGAAYTGRVPDHARILFGPEYALLRRAIFAHRAAAMRRRDGGPARAILLSFGATDPGNATSLALDALDRLAGTISITVALSSQAPHLGEVRRRLRGRARLALDADMCELMVNSDLAIGAAGVSAYERAALGLPSIIVTLADNQRGVAASLVQSGAALDGGTLDGEFAVRLSAQVKRLIADADQRRRMAQAAYALIDGRGAGRVLLAIAGEIILKDGGRVWLRSATAGDETWLLELQRAPGTRRYAKNPAIPQPREHARWLCDTLADSDIILAIVELNGKPAGMVRLHRGRGAYGVAQHTISIAISPEVRRRGVGSAALALVRRLKPAALLDAEILPANAGSQAMFLKAGFCHVSGNNYRCQPLLV